MKKHLLFVIGIRHVNFNAAVKKLFGKKYSLDAEQAFSIQFAGIPPGPRPGTTPDA